MRGLSQAVSCGTPRWPSIDQLVAISLFCGLYCAGVGAIDSAGRSVNPRAVVTVPGCADLDPQWWISSLALIDDCALL